MSFGVIFELAIVAAGFIATVVLFAWSLCWVAASFDRKDRGRAARTAGPMTTREQTPDGNCR